MKKLTSFLIALACIGMTYAKDFNSAQLKLREDIKTFLAEEGYMPKLDSDGDITFKTEGIQYAVIISENESNPMYVVLYNGYNYNETYNRASISPYVSEMNQYKGLKLYLYENSFAFHCELFVNDAEGFTKTFKRYLEIMKLADDELTKLVSGKK